ncbi:hypothetical protein EGM51_10610 [Verrucomicrobia bacterium S94]|nr:hypothetical protein EGM51_10610 [Verrucomicrobia bacterium S94]
MMRPLIITLLLQVAFGSNAAVETVLTPAEINIALGIGLDNSNTVDRLDVLESWSGSLGSSGWTLADLNAALETGIALSNAQSQISAVEDLDVEAGIVSFPDVSFDLGLCTVGTPKTIDFSSVVGERRCLVVVRFDVTPYGYSAGTERYYTFKMSPGYFIPAYVSDIITIQEERAFSHPARGPGVAYRKVKPAAAAQFVLCERTDSKGRVVFETFESAEKVTATLDMVVYQGSVGYE